MSMWRGSTADAILQGDHRIDLRDRSLSTQDVTALAKLLSTSSQVSALILYNVRLNSDDAVSLARALEFNDTLATLNFTHNPIGEVGTAALAQVIKFNSTIREVSLANTVLNSQACALLSDALIMNRTLESLNLEKNRIAAQGARFLADALGANETLRTLWLDGNQIEDAGAKAIAAALAEEGGSRLERLSLANTGVTDSGAEALGDALVGNLWLRRLTMAKIDLAPQVLLGRVPEEEESAAASKGLQTIDLSGQALSATLDYPIVCRLAARNPRLARLRLSRAGLCGVTSGGRGRRSLAGLRSLALTLKAAPPRLVVLDIGHNFIDDSAIEVIATGLEENRVLTNLILQGNGIGDKGMTILAAALPSSIVELDLSNNPAVGEKGGKAIALFLLDFVRSANLRRLDVTMCNLGDEGLVSLAEGVGAAKGLEWLGVARNLNDPGSVVGAGAGSGVGKTALGLALLSGQESRLQALSVDLWTVSKGQKDLTLFRPKGTVRCQLPSTADVCLLAGVICLHDWLRRVCLDGNPIDEEGLGYLSRALLRNGSVQTVSLNRCGLGERSGALLLHVVGEKPGLEIDACDGNAFGEEIETKLAAALKGARGILSGSVECRRTTVHLLGEAGAGKSTLKETLGRGYFSSFFNTSLENAPDRGAEDPFQRTLGVTSDTLALGAGSAPILVRDHGGLRRFRGVGAVDGGLACPSSVYVVVVSLTVDKAESKRQIKHWLRLVQTVGPASGSVIVLVGSRADELGSVGQDYLQKLWDRTREDLTLEELRSGLDASLPTFAGCLAMDCRKAGNANVARLREAIAHADKLFGQEGEGWAALPLYPSLARRVERWSGEGSTLVRWPRFATAVQRQLCSRASEAVCANLARSLAREGRILLRGVAGGGEVERGKGWVVLRPSFFLHHIVGGISDSAEARDGGGVISAAAVCASVLGGLGSVQPDTLVQALIDGYFCAELPPDKMTTTTTGSSSSSSSSSSGVFVDCSPSAALRGGARENRGGFEEDSGDRHLPVARPIGSPPSTATTAAAVARPSVAVPPAAAAASFGTYDDGRRRPSDKVERKHVVSVSTAAAAAAAAAGGGSSCSSSSSPRTPAAAGAGTPSNQAFGGASSSLAAEVLAAAEANGAAADASPRKPSAETQPGAVVRRKSSERWRALGLRKESWAKLERRRLLFPALLPRSEAISRREWARRWNTEACVCGRRVACRSPMLLPGLFHMLQSLLATRYPGRVSLRDRYAEVSLDGWDTTTGGIILPAGDDGGRGGCNEGGTGDAAGSSTTAITAAVELVESALPGGDMLDLTVTSGDRESSLLAVLGLRVIVEQILCEAPSVAIEDRAIAAASIRDGRPPNERLTLAMSEVRQSRTDGLKECFFGDNTLPEPLSDLLWEGPEECALDEAGRMMVSTPSWKSPLAGGGHAPAAAPSVSTSSASPPAGMARKPSVAAAAAAAVVANPFAGGPSRKKQASAAGGGGGGGGGGVGGGVAATAATARRNPFYPVVTPAPARKAAAVPAAAAGKQQAAPSSNPFAAAAAAAAPAEVVAEATAVREQPAITEPEKTSGQQDAALTSSKAKEGGESRPLMPMGNGQPAAVSDRPGGGKERGYGETLLATVTLPSHGGDGDRSSPPDLAGPDSSADVPSTGGPAKDRIWGGSAADRINRTGTAFSSSGARRSPGAAFSFEADVFRDAGVMFGAHVGGKSYRLGRQRVEVVLREPGGLRLGIWRPPVDEREEREREKDKGKAASELVSEHLSLSEDGNHEFNVFLSGANENDGGDDVGGTEDTGISSKGADGIADGGLADGGPRRRGSSTAGLTSPTSEPDARRSPTRKSPIPSPRGRDVSRLLTERPAVVEEVLHEDVVSGFNCSGSNQGFGVVGCVVASISREPFRDTEVSPKMLSFEEARTSLASAEYPLFVQLCRPPLVFSTEPEYPAVKLLSNLVLTNRAMEKVDGEFRCGTLISEDGSSRWLLSTTAVPASIPDLGTKMEVNLLDYHVVGLYLLTPEEAMSLLRGHPSQDVLLFVHGFNTAFNYGLRASAVKGRALRKPLTVCLAWPSNPPGEGAGWLIKRVMSTYERRYTYCEHNMHASIFLFLQAALEVKAAADASGKLMCWKGHSMGCYLLLNVVDRLRWKGEDMRALFREVILDAPDVPTWFFRSMVKVLAENGVNVVHYFNPLDNAIQASCHRRALQRPVPGQDAIVAHPIVQGVLCDKSYSSTSMNHDYGRADGRCLLDQRDFLAGEPPDQRVLEETVTGEGAACWQLKTW